MIGRPGDEYSQTRVLYCFCLTGVARRSAIPPEERSSLAGSYHCPLRLPQS
jgi:hypothetical protein